MVGPLAGALVGWYSASFGLTAILVLVPTPAVLAATALARHAAVGAASHGDSSLPELSAVRFAFGPLRGSRALSVWTVRLRFAILSLLFGAWILVGIVVGMAASGGAFWL